MVSQFALHNLAVALRSRNERGTLRAMTITLTREAMWQRLGTVAKADTRIVGLVDYGSSSEGRADAWSDVDAALFIADTAFDAFVAGWRAWAAAFGPLLLAYVGGVGHPWEVYDAAPVPLSVDFDLHRASTVDAMRDWPNSPVSATAMVRYDGTNSLMTAAAALVGRSLAPLDPAATFTKVSGDLWYYLVRELGAVRHGDEWAARFTLTHAVTGNLCALLRLESGATDRWRASEAAAGIADVISPARLAALNACIPGPGMIGVTRALVAAARLGRVTCAATAAREGWDWPAMLAERVITLYEEE